MKREFVGQARTVVSVTGDNQIEIAQDQVMESEPALIYVDPLFVPTLIKWLQEAMKELADDPAIG